MIRVERTERIGDVDGRQVAADLRTTERVDRLFRIADENQLSMPVKAAPQDLPLERVGVLEFVDEDQFERGPDALARRLTELRVGDDPVQDHLEVVVGPQSREALATFDAAAHALAESHALGCGRRCGVCGVVGLRRQRHPRAPDGLARDRHRLADRKRGAVGITRIRRQVQIERGLFDDVVGVFDDVVDQFAFAEETQGFEHPIAERVCRRDRRGVEIGERLHETSTARADLVGTPGQHRTQHRVVVAVAIGVHAGRIERDDEVGEACAHTLAQFGTRRAAERDQQQLVDRQAVGDLSSSDADNRIRLTCPSAGLEDRCAAGQRCCNVERLWYRALQRLWRRGGFGPRCPRVGDGVRFGHDIVSWSRSGFQRARASLVNSGASASPGRISPAHRGSSEVDIRRISSNATDDVTSAPNTKRR